MRSSSLARWESTSESAAKRSSKKAAKAPARSSRPDSGPTISATMRANLAGATLRPRLSTVLRKHPSSHTNVVMSRQSAAIHAWLYANRQSNAEYTSQPASLSNSTSGGGGTNGSGTSIVFSSW